MLFKVTVGTSIVTPMDHYFMEGDSFRQVVEKVEKKLGKNEECQWKITRVEEIGVLS